MIRLLIAFLLSALLVLQTGCSSRPSIGSLDASDRLDELPRAVMPSLEQVVESPVDVVTEGYKGALELIQDVQTNEDILRRLAVLELRKAEDLQVNDASLSANTIYSDAIKTYEALLASQQYREDNDRLLYPLAKAMELSGDLDGALKVHTQLIAQFPESQYYSEVQFRRGELLFSERNYRQASIAYKAVVDRDLRDISKQDYQPSPYLLNAHYMWGWSDFKLGRYTQSMRPFIVVVDHYTKEGDASAEASANEENTTEIDSLEKDTFVKSANSALLDDTLRVLALAFSYEEGAKSISILLDEVGERTYANKLYQNLGELYLDKKRFLDSADVYASYINRYPASSFSPSFHQSRIEAFIAGHFPNKVREEKKIFSRNYAVDSEYWLATDQNTQDFIKQKLVVYLDELASYHHSLAQKTKNTKNEDVSVADIQALAQSEFREAANWYEEWIRSFPESDQLVDKYFLLGETRFESTDFAAAVAAYEMAAYSFGQFEKANEAGYAALLSYDKLIALAPDVSNDGSDGVSNGVSNTASNDNDPSSVANSEPIKRDWQLGKIESALLFAENFLDDPRRTSVLAQSVEVLLQLGAFDRTIDVAQILLASENIENPLRFTGWVSSAHAHVAMERYLEAETAYDRALNVLKEQPNNQQYVTFYEKTLDNYAASIYKQGEEASHQGDKIAAANTFLRIVEKAPLSKLRVTAQHDASVLLMETEQWQAAINVISDFQSRFPTHQSNESAPARLLKANQALGNWYPAAVQAMVIADTDLDPEARRVALYAAAELFERAGDDERTIDTYRRYAHNYEQPLAERMEAQFKLVGMYEKVKEPSKRMFWVKKLVDTHDGSRQKTERSTYLAAYASAEMASIDWGVYQTVKLKNPIKKSLAKKRKAMDKAIVSYEKTADYDVEKYTTLATQKMGEIYSSFAVALMNSERPKNLSELEKEQYDILLEEQAYPFEEQAIEFFTVNIERAWKGSRTDAIKHSYKALTDLLPGRYNKPEIRPAIR